METIEKDLNLAEKPGLGRRAAVLLGGAALAGMAISRSAGAQSATVTDSDILNFALNLEYLEAQFYTLATTGKTIDQVGIAITGPNNAAGGTVTVKANAMVPFTTPLLQQFAMEIGDGGTESRQFPAHGPCRGCGCDAQHRPDEQLQRPGAGRRPWFDL